MSTGNFLSALVQRGVQAGAGALHGQVVGQERARVNARQAHDDLLQQAVIESNLKTAGLQQHELDPAVMQARAAATVAASLERIRAQHAARLEEIKAQGATQREVARVRAANSGRTDQRVGVETHKIADFQRRGREERAQIPDFSIAGDTVHANRADSTARAMDDSAAVHSAARDRIVGLGGAPDQDAHATKEPITQEDYDALKTEGYSREEIANDFDVSGVQ